MESFLIILLQFMLSISLLVLLHEGGHFFFSKLFGVRVEKFYLFFDVTIGKWKGSIFKFKPKFGDTEYGMGWLPLGGYCKISGMIDESFDTDQMSKPAEAWEFRSKPAWQRLLIMIGGVTVNFFLALFIYSMVMFTWGEDFIQMKDMNLGMKFNKEAKALGFQDHDILIGTDIREFKEFNVDVFRDLSEAHRVDLLRNGKKMSIELPGDINLLSMLKTSPVFVRPFLPAEVDTVLPNGPAAKAGIVKGDKFIAINNKKIDSSNELDEQLGRLDDQMESVTTHRDSLKLRTISLVVAKAQSSKLDTLNMVLTPDLKFEIGWKSFADMYKVTHVDYGFWESFPVGTSYGWNVLKGYVSDMKYVFTADGAKSIGGFGAIGSLFPAQWDWHQFWLMTAFLSIILAFMNILPIPALDGGHVLFLLYEMITRRKPSENFMIKAEYIGITILFILLIIANLNDVLRWLGFM
jgi:regulator of sigma E protease